MTFVPVTEMTTMQLADAVFSQLDTDDLGYEYDELLRRLALADPEAMVARVLEALRNAKGYENDEGDNVIYESAAYEAITAAMDVWRRGYGLAEDVDGVLYVYRSIK